jgi:hypothetical protein
MASVLLFLLCTIACGCIIVANCQSPCNKVAGKPSCVCDTPDGVIDLTSVANTVKGKPQFSSVLGESLGRFTYEYNPCYGFSYGYSGCNIGGDTVAACQSADFEDFSCGKMSTETFLLFSGNQNNQLYYSGGDDGRLY